MGILYVEYEYWFAVFQLVFAMLGMGATLKIGDFVNVIKRPRAVSVGVLMQLLCVPLVAYLFITLAGLTGGVAIGIALIAAIPGGATSNIFTFMAKGSGPLSISVTAITTLACLMTTPLILSVLITDFLPVGFSMPTQQIVIEIGLTLLLPLLIGMILLRYVSNHAQGISKWSIRVSLFGLALIIIGSTAAEKIDVDAFGSANMMVVCYFVLALTVISWLIPKMLGLVKKDITAVQMEVVVRNVNLGVLIKASMFPLIVGVDNALGDMVLFTILLYGAVQMMVAAVMIAYKRTFST